MSTISDLIMDEHFIAVPQVSDISLATFGNEGNLIGVTLYENTQRDVYAGFYNESGFIEMALAVSITGDSRNYHVCWIVSTESPIGFYQCKTVVPYGAGFTSVQTLSGAISLTQSSYRYFFSSSYPFSLNSTWEIIPFESDEALLDYLGTYVPPVVQNPITYIPINSVLSGPESAASGETVNVSVSFPDGYIYQETGVSIYNKDGTIPFTYADGTLTFIMP